MPLPVEPRVVDHVVVAPDAMRALATWLAHAWRLPLAARTVHLHHRVAPGVPAPPGLAPLLHALTGRLAVGNAGAAARVPRTAASAVRGLVRRALEGERAAATPGAAHDPRLAADAARARAVLAAGGRGAPRGASGAADWCVVALVERPAAPVALRPALDEAVPVGHRDRFVTRCDQLLLVEPGVGARPDRAGAARLAAAAAARTDGAAAWSWPAPERAAPWWTTELLLPEADALAAMTADARAAYLRATGRAGGAEAYWHLAAWARHAEPGRHVGHVSPAFLARRAMARGAPGAGAAARALSPRHDVGQLVPPGYCLVQVTATLQLALAA